MEALLIQSLTVGELKNLITDVITEQLKEHQKKEDEPQFITRGEATKLLHCSPNTLDSWTLKGYLKPYRFGTTIRFLKHEVIKAGLNIPRRGQKGGSHV